MTYKSLCRLVILIVLSFYPIHINIFAAIKWNSNFKEALNAAKIQNKPIMADFSTEWCGWCKKLDKDTYSNANVEKLAENFICVKIDAEKNRALAKQYKVNAYPTILFLNQKGELINKNVGYKKPADFSKLMQEILDKMTPYTTKNTEILDKPITSSRMPMNFVYNGYIQDENKNMIAQVNYYGKTYFVKKGETFEGYKVIDIDSNKLILENEKGTLIMDLKKPVAIR